MTLRHGFKADAERLALRVREELGIGTYRRLDPLRLADHLAIPVMSLSQLAARHAHPDVQAAVTTLHGAERDAVSAYTVVDGTKRVVVFNDANDPARSANDVTHELSHGLLLHDPAPALNEHGCRVWNGELEEEANFQSGALLIPAKAAWNIAKRRQPLIEAAQEYGCSVEVVRMRINLSGARRRLAS